MINKLRLLTLSEWHMPIDAIITPRRYVNVSHTKVEHRTIVCKP